MMLPEEIEAILAFLKKQDDPKYWTDFLRKQFDQIEEDVGYG